MGKESFLIYKSFYKPISKLSDKQLGRLFRAIFKYQLGEIITVEEDIEIAFEFFKNQFEIDENKYHGIVERNRSNGSKGGAPKRAKNDNSDDIGTTWKSHSTLTLLATQDLPTFLYYMIDPLKSWCWGAILFYPFKNSRFS